MHLYTRCKEKRRKEKKTHKACLKLRSSVQYEKYNVRCLYSQEKSLSMYLDLTSTVDLTCVKFTD